MIKTESLFLKFDKPTTESILAGRYDNPIPPIDCSKIPAQRRKVEGRQVDNSVHVGRMGGGQCLTCWVRAETHKYTKRQARRPAKAEQKSLLPAGDAQRTNQGRTPSFNLYSLSPLSPKFQQSAGATTL
jgi:hypothetical protein